MLKNSLVLKLAAIVLVLIVGVISRTFPIGNSLFDKYLGDALYAVLLYLILRIVQPARSPKDMANWAMILVFAIELFQLTGIPLAMRQSGNGLLELASIVLGTHFSWYDIVAYAAGIMIAFWADTAIGQKQ